MFRLRAVEGRLLLALALGLGSLGQARSLVLHLPRPNWTPLAASPMPSFGSWLSVPTRTQIYGHQRNHQRK
jgi:hypothetical protein